MDDDTEVIPEEDNDIDDNDDEELDAIDGAYENDRHQELPEEDDDYPYVNDGDYFSDSILMQLTLMTMFS